MCYIGSYIIVVFIIYLCLLLKHYELFKKYEYEFEHHVLLFTILLLTFIPILFSLVIKKEEEKPDYDNDIKKIKECLEVMLNR